MSDLYRALGVQLPFAIRVPWCEDNKCGPGSGGNNTCNPGTNEE